MFEVAIEPLERWNCWRKKSVHVRLVFIPLRFQCRSRELGLRFEEIIKASLFCTGPLANGVHRSRAVAVLPHQIQRRIGQAFFHITYSWHDTLFIHLDYSVNYFLAN